MKNIMRAALAASTAILVAQAHAGVVINTPGGASVGIQDGGALGFGGVGIAFTGVGDGITPGCLCEGWGASGNGVYGQSGNANGGDVNITILPFVGVAGVSGTSTVQVGGGPLVTQAYGLSASQYLVRDTVTLTNNSGALMTDVRYTRSMDWDIPPTTFAELVTIQRNGSTKLLFSSDNGFGFPNPLVNPGGAAGTINTDFVDNGPADHGAFFTFGFGNLAIGASTTFDIFYGAAPSEVAALGALGAVSAEVYSFGQQNGDGAGGTPATFIFGFAGVGGTPVGVVPEPSGIALMLTAFGIAGAVGRKAQRRKQS